MPLLSLSIDYTTAIDNLFGYWSPAHISKSITLVCLAKKRIERFMCPSGQRCIRWNSKGSNISHLLNWITGNNRSSIKAVGILKILRQTLKKRQRLTEIDLPRHKTHTHKGSELHPSFSGTILPQLTTTIDLYSSKVSNNNHSVQW